MLGEALFVAVAGGSKSVGFILDEPKGGPPVSKVTPTSGRRWLRPVLGTLAAVAIIGVAMSWTMLGSWTEMLAVVPAEIEQTFADARVEAGAGEPYIEVLENGEVLVHREQEQVKPVGFGALVFLAWAPGDEKVLRVQYPRWFVRVKTSSFVNLGTMIAALRKDWRQLDLSVSYADLMKRGPGLLLDHQAQSGARILLWATDKERMPSGSDL